MKDKIESLLEQQASLYVDCRISFDIAVRRTFRARSHQDGVLFAERPPLGYYPFRYEELIPFYSILARDYLIRTGFFTHITSIMPQPAVIPYKDSDGRDCAFCPDFLVQRSGVYEHSWEGGAPQMVVLDPGRARATEEHLQGPKWDAARKYAQGEDWELCVLGRDDVRDFAFRNIEFLRRFRSQKYDEQYLGRIVERVRDMGVATVHYLLKKCFSFPEHNRGIAYLWHLLATRRLECDIGLPLRENLELWIPYR